MKIDFNASGFDDYFPAMDTSYWTAKIGVELAKEKDDQIRKAIEEAIGEFVLDMSFIKRMARYIDEKDRTETFYLDGRKLIQFYPIEPAAIQDGRSTLYRVTQKYRTFR